jgi:hypothetical protein
MNSIAGHLPPEIARQIDPVWRTNEAAYWAVRDQLLAQYQGQWIGFADGAVIASGSSPVAVFHAAEASGQSPFVTCVGREDEPTRMRRASFAYDGSYPGEPLPILSLEFRPAQGSPGTTLDRVIADTGADASALPWTDCQALQLTPAQGRPGWMAGVAGGDRAYTSFSRLGTLGWPRTPLPSTSRFHWQRTHPRSRRFEPLGGVVPRPCWRSGCQSVMYAAKEKRAATH